MERMLFSKSNRLVLCAVLSLSLCGCLNKDQDNGNESDLASMELRRNPPLQKSKIYMQLLKSTTGSSTATVEVTLTAWNDASTSTMGPGPLTVHFASRDPSQITVSPSTLEFTALNYEVPQKITMTRVPNSTQQLWQARIIASADDLDDSEIGVTFSAWDEISPANNLGARQNHSMVWTGSQTCVWGGVTFDNVVGQKHLNTGECYSQATKTWTPMTTTNAPIGRELAVAVWTGSEMCVWGGYRASVPYPNSGGCYNPATDTWSVTSPSPIGGRLGHVGVWTGSQMCIWGGYNNSISLNDGACYSPSTNTWSLISNVNAPSKRDRAAAVWTGNRMCVWSGVYSDDHHGSAIKTKKDGGCYDPATDSWVSISTVNAPVSSLSAVTVWTGSQMCVWGGYHMESFYDDYQVNGGGCYDPVADIWSPIATSGAPTVSTSTAVWTGTKMCVWGGIDDQYSPFGSGGCYDPSVNQWVSSIDGYINSPTKRSAFTGVWTGSEMCIWGGVGVLSVEPPIADGACIKL